MQKYSEEIIRHRAVTGDGKPREILERITYLREVRPMDPSRYPLWRIVASTLRPASA
jgi:hypothetical protein